MTGPAPQIAGDRPPRVRGGLTTCLLVVSLVFTSSTSAGSPVADAAERQEWKFVESRPGDVNTSQPDETTALHWAVRHGSADAVRALLDAGADVDAENHYGVRPLGLACVNGDADCVRLLLDAGADASYVMPTGRTMLMTAARTGVTGALDQLLAAGADVDAADPRGQTALMWAAAEGHSDVVSRLLASGADRDATTQNGFSPLFFAARNGHIAVCERLVDAGADVNAAIRPQSTSGRNPRARMSPLMFAVESGHFELALRLVELGADPNDQRSGYAPLHALTWVRRANRGDSVEGDPEPRGSGGVTSLDFVRRLVAAGAKVDLRLQRGKGGIAKLNPQGATPFLLASHTADLPYMRVLLELSADPLATNGEGCGALAAAAGIGVVSLVDEDPGTEEEVIAAIELLHSLGLDVNAVDRNGETAMHGAAYRNYPAAVRHLHALGADAAVWNRKNKYGWTPLDIADGKRPGAFKPSPPTRAALEELLADHALTD